MSVPLADLSPRILASVPQAQRLEFLCPLCRKTPIGVDIWNGPQTELKLIDRTVKLWHAEQGPNKDWATLIITPSIDASHGFQGEPPHGCNGWHGHITNGVCT